MIKTAFENFGDFGHTGLCDTFLPYHGASIG